MPRHDTIEVILPYIAIRKGVGEMRTTSFKELGWICSQFLKSSRNSSWKFRYLDLPKGREKGNHIPCAEITFKGEKNREKKKIIESLFKYYKPKKDKNIRIAIEI